MIELIATAGSLIVGGGIGFAIARPWQDWTIKRINKDRADLRRQLTAEQACVETYATEIRVLRAERNIARNDLAAEHAKRSARIAAGNRTRRIKRLAAEAEQARLTAKAAAAVSRKVTMETVQSVGGGL
jgi:capsule polysaccharide export protein KpsE/RkpR